MPLRRLRPASDIFVRKGFFLGGGGRALTQSDCGFEAWTGANAAVKVEADGGSKILVYHRLLDGICTRSTPTEVIRPLVEVTLMLMICVCGVCLQETYVGTYVGCNVSNAAESIANHPSQMNYAHGQMEHAGF